MTAAEKMKLIHEGKWETCPQLYQTWAGGEKFLCCANDRSLKCDGNKLTCKKGRGVQEL